MLLAAVQFFVKSLFSHNSIPASFDTQHGICGEEDETVPKQQIRAQKSRPKMLVKK
jgi:hypothetical protein